MKKVVKASTVTNHNIDEYLKDDVYRHLSEVEKRIIAKAQNSTNTLFYLIVAGETLEAVGWRVSPQFRELVEMCIKGENFVYPEEEIYLD